MTSFWQYLWPAFGIALLVGVVTGLIGFRRTRRRSAVLAGGLAIALAGAAVWHGPLGGADRLASQIERRIRLTLVYYEMTQVSAKLQHQPLSRHIILSGPADDFQRGELVRVMNEIPGVSGTSWNASGRSLPLIVEGLLAAVAGFLLGLLVAYGVERRRRYNAQWNW